MKKMSCTISIIIELPENITKVMHRVAQKQCATMFGRITNVMKFIAEYVERHVESVVLVT